MIRDLQAAHPVLRERYLRLVSLWDQASPNEHLQVTCVWRSPEEQYLLWAGSHLNGGPWRTDFDGHQKRSPHNLTPSRAIDVCVLVHGVSISPDLTKVHVASWEEAKYAPLGNLCKEVGLVWGGWWPGRKADRPHIELPAAVPQIGAAA